MEINNSDIISIFNKLGGKNEYYLKIFFDKSFYRFDRKSYEKLLKRFIYSQQNGGLAAPYKMATKLTIKSEKSQYNIEIDGKNEVKKHWQFNELPEIPYVMRKEIERVDNDKLGLSFVLEGKDEKEVDKSFGGKKQYRLRNIYEIRDEEWNFYINLIEEKEVESEKNFKESACIVAIPNYYIEIYLPHDLNLEEIDNFIEYFGRYLRWLLEELQSTKFIINTIDKERLSKNLKKLMKKEMGIVEPVDILRRNFHTIGNFPYVRENYCITYLLNGELMYLFISENFNDNIDSTIFMVNREGEFISTGIKINGYENTLMEGYFNNNTFYITDIIFYKGNDLRSKSFFKRGGAAKEKYRYDALNQIKAALLQKEYVDEDLKDETTKIIVAKYLFGNGGSFEDNINELFDKIKLQDFTVSGLLFKPIDKEYPDRYGNWYEYFKWNFPENRRIDFLVKYEKNGKEDKISPFQLPSKGKDLEGKIIQYKSLNLYVGGIRDVGSKKLITPVNFLPRNTDPETEINIANIPLSKSGEVIAHNPFTNHSEIIEDNSVVEFVYQRIYGEYTNLFKWTPVQVNHVKTRMVRDGKISALISENYSNHMWNALTNSISELNLREGNVPEEDISQMYYAVNNSLRLKKYPFQVFHNRVVKDKLIMSVCPAIIKKSRNMEGSLLDLASGSGGDTLKWKLGKLKNVVGIEIVETSVETARELYRKTKGVKPNITYIWGNSGKLIFPDFDVALNQYNKNLIQKTILSKYQFDVVSMQFAIHYLFEDEVILRTFLQNVTDNLKIGGYFIGTSMDGKRVFDLLKGMKKPAEGMVGDDLLWKIEKKYSIKTFDESKPMLGHKIEVFVSTIGIAHEEFLVNYKFLEKICKEYGLELVSRKGFGTIYEDEINGKYSSDMKMMADSEKTFSFLHNEFKFIKKKDASDAVYKKLRDMMEKKKKREEKLKKFVGGDKKITLKLRK